MAEREWTHAICERCWFDGPGCNAEGQYRMPSRTARPEPGPCCYCGGLTIAGIFVRADGDTLMCLSRHGAPDDWSQVGVQRPASGTQQ